MLEKIEGPACRRCGCRDARVVRRGRSWGRAVERRQCGHCGWVWECSVAEVGVAESGGGAKVVPFVRVVCPGCGGVRVPVKSKQGVRRYHRCSDCGEGFWSVEEAG